MLLRGLRWICHKVVDSKPAMGHSAQLEFRVSCMQNDESEEKKRGELEHALSELNRLLMNEFFNAANAYYGKARAEDSRKKLDEATRLADSRLYNLQLAWDDPQKWHTLPEFIAASTGIVGFDETGKVILDEERVLPHLRRLLAGNSVFESFANRYFHDTFGTSFSFTVHGRIAPPQFSHVLERDKQDGRGLN